MPILGVVASSLQQATGSFFSIASQTISSNQSSVTFNNVDTGNFTHLQIRTMTRFAGNDGGWAIYFNGDTTPANYYSTAMVGTGTGAGYTQAINDSFGIWTMANNNYAANNYSFTVADILDYKNTNKKKTLRSVYGTPSNTDDNQGRLGFTNILWNNASSLTTIRFESRNQGSTSDFAANSVFAIYGIKVKE